MANIQSCHRGGFEARAGWWIIFDYDEALIASIKDRIPATQRSYNDDTKAWWFSEAVEEVVLGFLPQFETFLKQASLF